MWAAQQELFHGYRSFRDLGLDGPSEPQVVAVVGQRPDFWVLAVVANAHKRYPGFLDDRNELLDPAAIFVASHAVHLECKSRKKKEIRGGRRRSSSRSRDEGKAEEKEKKKREKNESGGGG